MPGSGDVSDWLLVDDATTTHPLPATPANTTHAAPPAPPANTTHADPAAAAAEQEQQEVLVVKEEDTSPAVQPPPQKQLIQQLDLIVMDVSGSMKARTNIDPDMTREDLSKLVFHTMVDKLICLEMDHAVGLLSFGQAIEEFEVTMEYESFHTQLGRLDARQNQTRLFDAIVAAADQLKRFRASRSDDIMPNAPMRIFALTDGEDNASTVKPWEVARLLQKEKIILDAFPMACRNAALHALCEASGGVSVNVTSVDQGTSRFEDETLLHVASRPEGPLPEEVVDAASFEKMVAAVQPAAPSTTSVMRASAAAMCRGQQQQVSATCAATPVQTRDAQTCSSTPSRAAMPSAPSTGMTAALRRVMREYTEATQEEAAGWFSVFVCDGDAFQWKILFQGPDNSPYASGHFVLSFHFPSDYPFKPPKVRFLTPVYHCNVNDAGSVCLDILKSQWSPALTAVRVVRSIQSLMADPNPDDPLDSVKATLLRQDPAQYNKLAAEGTQRWASDVDVAKKTYGLGEQEPPQQRQQ